MTTVFNDKTPSEISEAFSEFGPRITSVFFDECDFSGNDFSNLEFSDCFFSLASFKKITRANFRNCKFVNCHFDEGTFIQCDFSGANFDQGTIKKVTFDNCNLDGATFEGSDKFHIYKTVFLDCQLNQADFSKATFSTGDSWTFADKGFFRTRAETPTFESYPPSQDEIEKALVLIQENKRLKKAIQALDSDSEETNEAKQKRAKLLLQKTKEERLQIDKAIQQIEKEKEAELAAKNFDLFSIAGEKIEEMNALDFELPEVQAAKLQRNIAFLYKKIEKSKKDS